jgi:exonuclease III
MCGRRWTTRCGRRRPGGWRIDQIFASPPLCPIACRYHHAWRDPELSDHSALEAEFAWR